MYQSRRVYLVAIDIKTRGTFGQIGCCSQNNAEGISKRKNRAYSELPYVFGDTDGSVFLDGMRLSPSKFQDFPFL